jgi:hypothetical protein
MPRHKNVDWNLSEGTLNPDGSRTHRLDRIQAALLMDIRDELQALNRVFSCPNFTRIPGVLDRIEANTKRRKYTHKTAK